MTKKSNHQPSTKEFTMAKKKAAKKVAKKKSKK